MREKGYRCIVSDLDLTLLNSDKTLSSATKQALKILMGNGILFVPASGRGFYSFPACIMGLPGIQYAIASNGVAIYDVRKKEPVSIMKLPKDTAEELFCLLRDHNVAYEGFIDGQAYVSRSYFEEPQNFGAPLTALGYVRSTRKPVEDIQAFLKMNHSNLDCIDVIVPMEMKNEVYSLLEEKLPNVYMTTSVPHLIEISNKDCGKHRGLERLMKRLSVDLSEVVAFGDGDNDSEMLACAGIGIAVANATEKCREAADFVTDRYDRDGVAKALKRLFPAFLG